MKYILRRAILTCALAASLGTMVARADQTINGFDSSDEVNSWSWENWSVAGTATFDPADDANADGASGSLELVANFANISDYQQAVFTTQLNPPPHLPDFAKVGLDLKVDADSLPQTDGVGYGHFEIILRVGSSWTWTSISFDALSVGDWTHIEANIPTVSAPDDTLNALTLKIGDGNFTGPITVYVDNITLIATPPPITVIDAFNDDSEVTPWAWENWSVAGTAEFDPTNDAGGGTSPGSLKITASFDNLAGYQQNEFTAPVTPPFDGVTYSQIAMDVKVDAADSTLRTGLTDYGSFEIVLRNGVAWDWNSVTNINLTDSGWVHVVANLTPPDDAVHHLTLKLGQNGFGGPVVYNVDNIVLLNNTNKAIVQPTLSLQKSQPGLNIFASQLAQQYQRQSIRTVSDQFSWVGRPGPVTFSMDITKYPNPAAYSGFQAQIFLLPDTAPANPDVDWSQPNIVFVDIIGQANGSTIATFHYKINEAGGNTMLYNSNPANGPVGTLGSVTSSTPLGKWSLTFTGDTHITLTAPDGTTAQMDMPSADAALFGGSLYAYFGAQPNQLANLGQSIVIDQVQITGTSTPLTDSFSGDTLDADVWATAAADANGIILAPAGSAWWVGWTTPAPGFVLQANPSLTPADWKDVAVTSVPIGSNLLTLLPAATPPVGNATFFRLIKR